MNFYFSVISHHHQDLIKALGTLERLAKFEHVSVIFRDNVKVDEMQLYCTMRNIKYVANTSEAGFSRNNNLNYLHAISLGMKENDYFILLNPDVDMSTEMIAVLLERLRRDKPALAAPNLYLDKNETLFDDNLRLYPNFVSFVKNYLFNSRKTVVDKSKPESVPEHFWASGAFLAVNAGLYRTLGGFDETYYMYCEDVDFCLRANRHGERIKFMDDVHAIHYRRRSSQDFMSQAFFQHVKSVFLYHFASRRFRTNKSCLKELDNTMKKAW
ncbi:glycosyltransferase family 2 protein [Vibrio astriarenae]